MLRRLHLMLVDKTSVASTVTMLVALYKSLKRSWATGVAARALSGVDSDLFS